MSVIEQKTAEEIPLLPRAYQIEMLDQSMRRNVIVCMETGSGKTMIAAERIKAELASSSAGRIWFLAPSVALCLQQHDSLTSQLSSHQIRLITSLDNARYWSTQNVWDAALYNMEVVVSTPQVLLDALTHAFVRISQLSLLVFDEAHHCAGNAPMSQIMTTFYHSSKRQLRVPDLPNVLGLTASPVTSAKSAMEGLEQRLDAICKSPTEHVEVYKQYVHEPEFVALSVALGDSAEPQSSPLLERLYQMMRRLDINEDPYIRHLRADGRKEKKILELLESKATMCFRQLKKLVQRAKDLSEDVGDWAATEFVLECFNRLKQKWEQSSSLVTLETEEYGCLVKALSIPASALSKKHSWSEVSLPQVSAKATRLIDYLIEHYKPESRCVIFVKPRSSAWAIARLIATHPGCIGKYAAEPFVGLSKVDRSFTLVDLVKMTDPREVLNRFKGGSVNVIVATSVMEEGIDIPATNLVVRWDDSENFRSFIQSRGRARHVHSKFITLLPPDQGNSAYASWKALEAAMIAKYQEEYRQLAEMEQEEESDMEPFRVESTGALLTWQSAKQHVEHFCATLPKVPFADDPRPEYVLTRESGLVSAKILLPGSVDIELREAASASPWLSERMATNDAAFQAYTNLYRAGLINDHLLPVLVPQLEELRVTEPRKREAICEAAAQFDPWRAIAATKDDGSVLYQFRIDVTGQTDHFHAPLFLILPAHFNTPLEFPLFWSGTSSLTVSVIEVAAGPSTSVTSKPTRQATVFLLKTVFARKMLGLTGEEELPYLFAPAENTTTLSRWLDRPYDCMPTAMKSTMQESLVRREGYSTPAFVRRFPGHVDGRDWRCAEYIDVMQLPKRVDFIHPILSEKAHTAWEAVETSDCHLEKLPAAYARTMLLVPSILHYVELALMTQEAVSTVLAPVGFRGTKLVMSALTASSANEQFNYQRLEFLGDSLLKFYSSIQLYAQNPKWHEGYLSHAKDRIVGNSRLCQAAIETGVDAFIHNEPFAGAQWKVRTVSDLLSQPMPAKRQMSTKVLADVIEALIGAAYLDGDSTNQSEPRSLACLKLLIPEISWQSVQSNLGQCQCSQLPTEANVCQFEVIDEMVGYALRNRMLLAQAMTHPSAIGGLGSYQRLEFLGDAVLEKIVTTTLMQAQLEHFQMHLIRTAAVNADFLAYLCLGVSTEVERMDVITNGTTHESKTFPAKEEKYLCQFLATSGNPIGVARKACIERYVALQEAISGALEAGQAHPWTLLASLKADKFVSDIIESLVGAIFIDSNGSIEECRAFLGRIGVLRHLERLIQDPAIEVMHPKERLGVVSRDAKITYVSTKTAGRDGSARFACVVRVDGEVSAEARDCLSKAEAESRAAEMAIEKLRRSPSVEMGV